jgi:hypothetical protein
MRNLLFSFLLFLPVLIFSQAVNIEKKREGEEDKNLIGRINLAVNFNKSANSIFTAQNSTQIQYHQDKNIYLFLTDLQMMQIDTIRYLNNGFFHFRYNHNFDNEWFIAEAFSQVQFNRIQKIQRRFLWGTGGRFIIWNDDKYKIFAGLAAMYEFELYIDNTFQDYIRMSDYISLELQPTPELKIRHTTYYQPKIDQFGNFRITNETSLEVKLLKNLSFRTAFNHFYDSKPAPAVQKIFYSLNNGISYRF